ASQQWKSHRNLLRYCCEPVLLGAPSTVLPKLRLLPNDTMLPPPDACKPCRLPVMDESDRSINAPAPCATTPPAPLPLIVTRSSSALALAVPPIAIRPLPEFMPITLSRNDNFAGPCTCKPKPVLFTMCTLSRVTVADPLPVGLTRMPPLLDPVAPLS